MRVLMTDLAPLSEKRKSGVGYYTQQLVNNLRDLAGPDFVYSFPDPWLEWKFDWLTNQCRRFEYISKQRGLLPWIEKKVRGKVLDIVRKTVPMMQNPFEEAIRESGSVLYHEPNFVPRALNLPTVISVHDLSVILHPEWHPRKRVLYFEREFHKGLQQCSHIIAISECGKSEIVRHLGWPAEKVSVTYMGVRQGLQRVDGERLSQTLKTLGLKAGYLLHVGTLEPRKNVLMLLKAYCDLPGSVREKHPLVLVGGKGWNVDDVLTYVNREARHKGVRWLGYV
ncbi:MAG: glycosyltransferase, partial [Thermomicrobiales bacterium]